MNIKTENIYTIMNHIMLRAEFPGAEQEHLNEIHSLLNQRNWVRVSAPGEEVNIWQGTFDRQMREEDCHNNAINAFIEASKRYCKVQLDILWASHKPAVAQAVLLG